MRSAVGPDGVFRIEALPPFGSGSMGGYWTLAEIKMKLDSLVASDTRDLVADKLDTLGTTAQGRPIWGLRLGKRVEGPDTRPVVFFNALTHAREPEGMQTLFYFVDDLLARYDTDPFASYLLDQRVIYICPVVNPDGYDYNQTISPGGGGDVAEEPPEQRHLATASTSTATSASSGATTTWARAARPPARPTAGRRPSPSPRRRRSATWSTPSSPSTGISFHTYSDLFLHPWGYVAAAAARLGGVLRVGRRGDAGLALHRRAGLAGPLRHERRLQRLDLRRHAGQAALLHLDARDRHRRATASGRAPSRIVPLAQENLRKCYTVAAIAGPYVRVESSSLAEGELIAGQAHAASPCARATWAWPPRPANLAATLLPLDAGAEVLPGGGHGRLPGARPRAPAATRTDGATFLIGAADTVTLGRMLRFEVDFTADGGYFSRDTVELLVGRPTTVLLRALRGAHELDRLERLGRGLDRRAPSGPLLRRQPERRLPREREPAAHLQGPARPLGGRARLGVLRGALAHRADLRRHGRRGEPRQRDLDAARGTRHQRRRLLAPARGPADLPGRALPLEDRPARPLGLRRAGGQRGAPAPAHACPTRARTTTASTSTRCAC